MLGLTTAIIQHGKSLLPAGVTNVSGFFQVGEVVEVVTQQGRVIGKGQCTYSAEELRDVKGMQSQDIQVRGERHSYEVIHRDALGFTLKGGNKMNEVLAKG